MRRAWARWVAFWDRREAPTALVLARWLVGLVLLWDFGYIIAHGLQHVFFAPPPDGLAIGAIVGGKPWVVRFWGVAPWVGERTFWIAFVALVLFTTGALTRVAGVTFALASAQLSVLAPDSDRGIDILLRIATVVLALSGANARWSVDAWVRRVVWRRPPVETVPAWPRYLLYLQLVWLYFSAGQAKGDPSWGPQGGFSALGFVLADPHYARFAPGWVEPLHVVTQLATAATMAFEWGAPALLLFHYWYVTRARPGRLRAWSNRLRLRFAYIAVGASFHLGIALTLRLGIFPFGVLALYPVFFHPEELRTAWRWLGARVSRARAPAASTG